MRTTTDRPVRIGGALLAIVVMSIVAAGLKVAELLEHTPDSHCPACGRTRTTCTCWGPHGAMTDA